MSLCESNFECFHKNGHILYTMNVKIQRYILLGYSDVAAAGCRALLGVDFHYHTDAEKLNQQVPNKDGTGFLDFGFVSCKGDTEFDNAFSPLQIINIPSKNVSIIILNCRPSRDISHELVNWLMNVFIANRVESLHILTALSLAETDNDTVYEMAMFQDKLKGFPNPPKETRTSDDIFNKLIQFIHVVKIPTSCFVVSGRMAKEGSARREELAIIQVLQNLAEELTSVKFNILTSRELVYSALESTVDEVKSMYL